MLNGDGSENSIKINRSNKQKKRANLHLKHTFLYISLPLFCTTTIRMLFRTTKT